MMLGADLGRAVLTALIPLSVLVGVPTMGVVLRGRVPDQLLPRLLHGRLDRSGPEPRGPPADRTRDVHLRGLQQRQFRDRARDCRRPGRRHRRRPDAGDRRRSFAVSAASLSLVHRSLRSSRPRSGAHIAHEIGEGVRFVRGHAVLRIAIGLWTAIGICSAPLIAALTFYITIDRGLGPSALGLRHLGVQRRVARRGARRRPARAQPGRALLCSATSFRASSCSALSQRAVGRADARARLRRRDGRLGRRPSCT